MKHYAWNPEKNEWLKRERGISFEDVVFHIQAGDEVDLFDHPDQGRYPGQRISIVLIESYAYLVPFIESENEIFLKTIIPSRKASKQYLGESDEQTGSRREGHSRSIRKRQAETGKKSAS